MSTLMIADLIRTPLPKPAKPRKSLSERHAAMTDRSGGPFACHPWIGSVMQQNGYGQIAAKSRITGKQSMRTAHTVAWEAANCCSIPKGMIVRHTCHNPLCQNPAHLLLGTNVENLADERAAGKRRKRLSREKILEIAALSGTAPALEVSLKYGVNVTTIRAIWRGKAHSHITGIPPHAKRGGRPRTTTVITMGARIHMPSHGATAH